MNAIIVIVVLCIAFAAGKEGIGPGDQEWGFYEVRPGAHMFYWLHNTLATSDRPLVIWIQGGPGASSTGYGNFIEIGVVDMNLTLRESSWVKHVNVLYIDNPVGAGFSYVESEDLYATDNQQIATDLVNFTRQFMKEYPKFSTTPIYIFSESYGGKMSSEFALYLYRDIQAGNIKANLKGVALGDSWISSYYTIMSYSDMLFQLGLIDGAGDSELQQAIQSTATFIQKEEWINAFNQLGVVDFLMQNLTHGFNVYNVLTPMEEGSFRSPRPLDYRSRTRQLQDEESDLTSFMNGLVKQKLGLPSNLEWAYVNYTVYNALVLDFMKPVVSVVESLLNETNLEVIVYTGHLDLIVNAPGTYNWVKNLKWSGEEAWLKSGYEPLIVNGRLEGHVKSNDRLKLYCIMRAGHMVPSDNPAAALEMMRLVTHYE